MQAIYEAILLIPQDPQQATRELTKMARELPDFLYNLKAMVLQLFNRFRPSKRQEQCQYQKISKQIIVLFNRFIIYEFQNKGNNVYLQVQTYYTWYLEIFLCQKISLTCKKCLAPSFSQIIKAISYQPKRFSQLIDYMMNNSSEATSSIFVYLQCLLESSIFDSKKVQSIKLSYQFLYYIAINEYKTMINYYKDRYMEDEDKRYPNCNFLQKLKQNKYIVLQICEIISFIYNISRKKNSQLLKDLANDLLLHADLAQYLIHFLRAEDDLFENKEGNYLYGLKMIIASNLRNDQKNVINSIKSKCLSTLALILEITDKSFNIKYTDKLLMRELPNFAEFILSQLIICSHNNIFASLSIQINILALVSSMFSVLTQITQFEDLKVIFQSLKVESIIRLSLNYMKTFEEEMKIYECQPEEYFHLTYYIIYGKIDDENIELGVQFCMKKSVASLIKQLNFGVEGYHTIMLDICSLYIQMEMKYRRKLNIELIKNNFLKQFQLTEDILQCFDLESVIFTFTILIDKWDPLQRRKRMRFLLQNKQCTINKMGYYFIEKLLKYNKDKLQYEIFLEKIMQELIGQFGTAKCQYVFDTIDQALKIQNITENVVNLKWITFALEKLNAKFNRLICVDRQSNSDILAMRVLLLYVDLLRLAEKKKEQNKMIKYADFEQDFDEYRHIAPLILNKDHFYGMQQILRTKDMVKDQQMLLYSFGQVIFQILIHSINLQQQQYDLIAQYSIALLVIEQQQYYHYLKKMSFKLIYQFVNIKIFSFDEWTHNKILSWMKQSYFKSQIFLNRVCIVLQELYFYISNNIFQNHYGFLQFYSSIIEILEKKFIQMLISYQSFLSSLEAEIDPDRKKIDELKIKIDPAEIKTNPITIIRLYNTILLNPSFDITLIRRIHQLLKQYQFQIIPSYDLGVQILALQSLVKRSKNISVIECFKFSAQLLGYNAKHYGEKKCRTETEIQKQIAFMTEQLHSSISVIDPYRQFGQLIDRSVLYHDSILNERNSQIDQIQMDIIDFLKNDKYMLGLVKKITMIRRVNNQPRFIMKIKRQQEQ